MKVSRPKGRHRKRNCLHCKELFHADYRNLRHQRYCSKPDCHQASKKASQYKYLRSEKGRGYFSGTINVDRVRQWRKQHPGYWKRRVNISQNALQDDCSPQRISNQSVKCSLNFSALQDICFTQPALIVGLIANLTGNALQDDIAKSTHRFINLGHDIMGTVP